MRDCANVIGGDSLLLDRRIIGILVNEKDRDGRTNPSDVQIQRVETQEESLARREREAKVGRPGLHRHDDSSCPTGPPSTRGVDQASHRSRPFISIVEKNYGTSSKRDLLVLCFVIYDSFRYLLVTGCLALW